MEATLHAAIGAATSQIDAVGTADLDTSLDALDGGPAAQQRLADAMTRMQGIVGTLLGSIAQQAAVIAGQLPQPAPATPVSFPAPLPTPEPVTRADVEEAVACPIYPHMRVDQAGDSFLEERKPEPEPVQASLFAVAANGASEPTTEPIATPEPELVDWYCPECRAVHHLPPGKALNCADCLDSKARFVSLVQGQPEPEPAKKGRGRKGK